MESIANGIARLVSFVARWPRQVLVAVALLTGLSLFGASGLGVDTDSSRMLNPDLPFQADALALRAAFPQDKTAILVLVEGDTADRADTALRQIVNRLDGAEGIAEMFAPAIDPFLMQNGLLWSDLATFDDQMRRISQSSNLIASIRADQTVDGFLAALDQARLLAEGAGREADLAPIYAEAAEVFAGAAEGRVTPLAWTSALAGEGGPALRVLTVMPEPDFTALNPVKPALRAVEAAVAEARVDPGLRIGITGDPVLRAEELRSVTARIFWSLGLSLGFVAIVLWLALGSLGRVVLGLGALLVTLALTAGAASVTVGSLNLISIAFIVLMVGLGIDFAIHFLAHLDERARAGGAVAEALADTARSVGPALVLAALSTSLAFFAFMATDFRGMAQLGVIGGTGVLVAFAVSVTVLPAVIALRPGLSIGRARGRVPAFLAAHPRFTWSMAALGLIAALIASQARFDADPMGLRDPSSGSVQSYNRLISESGRSPLRASILAPDRARAAALAAEAEALPQVESAIWLGALIPAEQEDKLALLDLAWPSIDHAVNGIPEELAETDAVTPTSLANALGDQPEQAALAAALRLYASAGRSAQAVAQEGVFQFFPALEGQLAALLEMDEVTVETLPSQLSQRYLSSDGLYRVEILPEADIRIPAERAAFAEALAEALPGATGAPVQIEGARKAVTAALIEALALSLAGAALLALLMLRSVAGVLAILLPVLLAGAICMAASVLLGMPFNYANVIVLPLMIGIGVDSGIHLALRSRHSGEVFDTATPMAAFYSALTTIAAFGTLGLSQHVGTASMGILLAIGLTATVLTCFALTPPLARLGRAT